MNHDAEPDNEEYVFVDFDNEMELDEESYDHCDDGELSLTPSTSASVCSETMFGDLGPISNNNKPSTDSSTVATGKPRSCSIVSLHDEEVQVPEPKPEPKPGTDDGHKPSTSDAMDIDEPMTAEKEEERSHPKPIEEPQDDSKAAAGVVAVAAAATSSNAKESKSKKKAKTEKNQVPEQSVESKLNIGSRMSNKKRRKKMKQLKKAAALAAFTAMKEQSSMQSISTTTSPTVSLKQTKQTPTKLALSKSHTRRISNSIAVLCATETLADYREELKEELKMKKKINGTLNFEPF